MRDIEKRLAKLESTTMTHPMGEVPSWARELAEVRHRESVTGKTGQLLAGLVGPLEYDPAEVERMARELAATFRDREDAERGRPLSSEAKDLLGRIMEA